MQQVKLGGAKRQEDHKETKLGCLTSPSATKSGHHKREGKQNEYESTAR
jgi:hypothetical protein